MHESRQAAHAAVEIVGMLDADEDATSTNLAGETTCWFVEVDSGFVARSEEGAVFGGMRRSWLDGVAL